VTRQPVPSIAAASLDHNGRTSQAIKQLLEDFKKLTNDSRLGRGTTARDAFVREAVAVIATLRGTKEEVRWRVLA